jgi:hypothetical protein
METIDNAVIASMRTDNQALSKSVQLALQEQIVSKTILIIFVTFAVLAVGCRTSHDRTETQNIDVIRAVFSEVWSKGNVELIDEYFAADYVGHFPAETFHGRRGIRNHLTAHRTAFPDWTEEIEDIIADRDRVAVRLVSQ